MTCVHHWIIDPPEMVDGGGELQAACCKCGAGKPHRAYIDATGKDALRLWGNLRSLPWAERRDAGTENVGYVGRHARPAPIARMGPRPLAYDGAEA